MKRLLIVALPLLIVGSVQAQENCERDPYFSGGGCVSDRAYYEDGVLTLPKVDIRLEDDTVTAKDVDMQWNGSCFVLGN